MGDIIFLMDLSHLKDSVLTDWEEWHGGVMVNMVFLKQWVNWIMQCVETIDYSIIVNENVVVLLLWVQFLLMRFSISLLIHYIRKGIVSFVYGSFLFFRASIKEVLAMKNILAA